MSLPDWVTPTLVTPLSLSQINRMISYDKAIGSKFGQRAQLYNVVHRL